MLTTLQHYRRDLLVQLNKVVKADTEKVLALKHADPGQKIREHYTWHCDRLKEADALRAALQHFDYPC